MEVIQIDRKKISNQVINITKEYEKYELKLIEFHIINYMLVFNI